MGSEEEMKWRTSRDVIFPSKPLSRSYVHAACSTPLRVGSIWLGLEELQAMKPSHEAYIISTSDKRLTYSHVYEKAAILARSFLAKDVQRGDKILLLGLEDEYFIYSLFAVSAVGAVFHAPSLQKPYVQNIEDIIARLRPGLILCGPGDNGHIAEALSAIMAHQQGPLCCGYNATYTTVEPAPSGFLPIGELEMATAFVSMEVLQKRSQQAEPDDGAFVLSSTGTTGKPKLIIVANIALFNSLNNHRRYTDGQRVKAVQMCPGEDDITIIASIVTAATATSYQYTAVIGPRLAGKPGCTDVLAEVIQRYECTHADFYPFIWLDMIRYEYFKKYNLTSLKGGSTSSQIVDPLTAKKFLKICPELVNLYAASEAGVISITFPNDPNTDRRMKSVGFPAANVEVKFIDDKEEIVPVNTVGEICVRSPYISLGYISEGGHVQSVRDARGWYHTGDVGRMDENGFMYLFGRKEDCLRYKRFGDILYPGPIEAAAKAHPAVLDAQVVGLHNKDMYGHDIYLCVRVRKDYTLTEKELREHCEDQLPERSHPDFYVFMDSFPLIGSRQKVSRRKLLEEVESLQLWK